MEHGLHHCAARGRRHPCHPVRLLAILPREGPLGPRASGQGGDLAVATASVDEAVDLDAHERPHGGHALDRVSGVVQFL